MENPPDNLELSPLDFWRSQEQSRELSKIILSIIQIPSSTASVERSFSIQKYIHSLNRNRLLHKHVREEMIIKFNNKSLKWKELEDDEDIYTG